MLSFILFCLSFSFALSEVTLYTTTHEFVTISDDGDYAEVGITNQKQDIIGPFTHVELPEVGEYIEQGDVVGYFVTVRGKFDLHAPLSGNVTQLSRSLEGDSNLEKINSVHAEDGWAFTMEPTNLEAEMTNLLTEEEIIYEGVVFTVDH